MLYQNWRVILIRTLLGSDKDAHRKAFHLIEGLSGVTLEHLVGPLEDLPHPMLLYGHRLAGGAAQAVDLGLVRGEELVLLAGQQALKHPLDILRRRFLWDNARDRKELL